MSYDLEAWDKFCILAPKGDNEGKNSRTYLAYDPQLKTTFVAKFIETEGWRDPESFLKEARILNSLSNDNIVKFSGCGFVKKLPSSTYSDKYPTESADELVKKIDLKSADVSFWVKQDEKQALSGYFSIRTPVADSSLSAHIHQSTPTNREAVAKTLKILQGLGAAHSKGVLHLDVKPSNILVKESNPMLTDFGISAWIGPQGFAHQPRFYCFIRPPETLTHGPIVDLRADIFQVGTTVYRMVNSDFFWNETKKPYCPAPGQILTKALFSSMLSGRFPKKNSFLAHVPQKLRSVIKKALQVNPLNRFESCAEFGSKLSALKGDEMLWDWRCQFIDSGRSSYSNEKRCRFVEVISDGNTWAVESYTKNSSGKRRAVRKYQAKNLSLRQEAEDKAHEYISDWK